MSKNIGMSETKQSEISPSKKTTLMPDTNRDRVVMDGSKGTSQTQK